MFEHQFHVRRLAQDAHVRQNAVIDQIMRAESVAAIFLAFKIPPLGFFDFAGHRGNDEVALESDSGFLQGFQRAHVAGERAFHVVNTETVNKSVF